MNYFKKYHIIFIIISIFLVSCNEKTKEVKVEQKICTDFSEILQRGSLIAVTDYNSTNYFSYKGQPMGFQYELLKNYAKHLGVKLDLKVSNDLNDKFNMLNNEECDLIAINLTVTKERSKIVDFTVPHTISRQVLIQRKPDGWRNMSSKALDDSLIRNQLELAGKTIYIQKNSSFYDRLLSLMDEIGDTIFIVDTTEYGVEQLISMVAKGEIDYTVCDENVAMVNSTYYHNIDIETAISFPQNLAWAVRKNCDSLLIDINAWMRTFKTTRKYKLIYNKYFKNSKTATIVSSDYYSLNGGKISKYDKYFKMYSKIVDWDWRLLASLVYQESRFDSEAESWAGAFGLMQLMPATAERFGVDTSSTAEQNILAGVKFLKWLDEKLQDRIKDKDERILFVLASYNAGR
ncbi:MAG: lytic transglycosylase F [Marinilabiliales bacterium]|nr:MAG: lytic transglycosylase F [Marinilabiliales bacterium]